jgi:hypothetical protein
MCGGRRKRLTADATPEACGVSKPATVATLIET